MKSVRNKTIFEQIVQELRETLHSRHMLGYQEPREIVQVTKYYYILNRNQVLLLLLTDKEPNIKIYNIYARILFYGIITNHLEKRGITRTERQNMQNTRRPRIHVKGTKFALMESYICSFTYRKCKLYKLEFGKLFH